MLSKIITKELVFIIFVMKKKERSQNSYKLVIFEIPYSILCNLFNIPILCKLKMGIFFFIMLLQLNFNLNRLIYTLAPTAEMSGGSNTAYFAMVGSKQDIRRFKTVIAKANMVVR